MKNATIIIQRAFRRNKFRKEFAVRILVCVILNRVVDQTWARILDGSATKINSLVRMFLCKCQNQEIVEKSRKIGAIARRTSSARKIQLAWRYYKFK